MHQCSFLFNTPFFLNKFATLHHVLLGTDAYVYSKALVSLYIIGTSLKKHPPTHLHYKQIFGLFS